MQGDPVSNQEETESRYTAGRRHRLNRHLARVYLPYSRASLVHAFELPTPTDSSLIAFDRDPVATLNLLYESRSLDSSQLKPISFCFFKLTNITFDRSSRRLCFLYLIPPIQPSFFPSFLPSSLSFLLPLLLSYFLSSLLSSLPRIPVIDSNKN